MGLITKRHPLRWSLLWLAGLAGEALALPGGAGLLQSTAVHAAMDTPLSQGMTGSSVAELQSRLGFLGYYHGALSGTFDWATYWAVRDFQYAFGLPVDGVVGSATSVMLTKATSAWTPQPALQQTASAANQTATPSTSAPSPASQPGATVTAADATGGLSASDENLMAHVVYGEARGQPYIGQVAVAAVILNRYHSSLFPHSIPAIIYQPGAFESIANGQAWLGLHKENVEATMDAIHGFDPTHGALYYWNPATATSPWVWSQPIMLTIGQHVFAK